MDLAADDDEVEHRGERPERAQGQPTHMSPGVLDARVGEERL